MSTRVPLLIDCDTGIDDAVALLYACGSPDAELLGVTLRARQRRARGRRAATRLAVLELAGRSDVEVALGRDRPIVRPLRIAPETHGPHGLGYAVPDPPRIDAEHSGPRPTSSLEVTSERPDEVTLVTLGPLTNLALAVLRDPDLPRRVSGLVMMVGAYRTAGNTSPDDRVERVGRPRGARDRPRRMGARGRVRRLGGATDGARPRRDRAREDDARPPGSAGGAQRRPRRDSSWAFLRDALRFYFEFHSRYDGFHGAFIHDALAVAVALDPSLGRTEALAVEVELAGRLTAGETVTDWRRAWGRPPNVDIVVEADTAAFFERFIERVGALAASRRG